MTGRKVGKADIQAVLRKSDAVQKDMDPLTIRTWFFGYSGFTSKAEVLMREKGVFWSVREDLGGLLRHVGLRPLPDNDVGGQQR